MNIKNKCQQIDSLLGDLSSTGIKPIPSLVFEMRMLLSRIEAVEQSTQADGALCSMCEKTKEPACPFNPPCYVAKPLLVSGLKRRTSEKS